MLRRIVALAIVLVAGEASADVGRGSSVAIGTDGLALISYADMVNRDLKVAHCSNAACTSATITTLDLDGSGNTAAATGADGRGLILYDSPQGLKVAHCSNAECTSAAVSTVVPGASLILRPGGSLAIGSDGRGVFAFSSLAGILYAAHCSNAACSAATSNILFESYSGEPEPHAGGIAIGGDGLPLIAFEWWFYLPSYYAAALIQCNDLLCSSRTTTQFGLTNVATSVAIGSDGLGFFPSLPSLRVHRCTNADCTTRSVGAPDPGVSATHASIARGADGLGLLAYVAGGDLKVAHCSDPACSSAAVTLLDAVASVGDAHLAIGADGLGLISYHDVNAGDLKVAHCENVECTVATISVVDDGVATAPLAAGLFHSPEPVPGLTDLTYRIHAYNYGPSPATNVTVTHTLPPGVVFQFTHAPGWSCAQASGVVTCTRSEMPPGLAPEIGVRVTAPHQQATLVSSVNVRSDTFDPWLGDNTVQDTATVTAAPVADLAITNGDGGAVGRWGQPFTWTITVSNAGPSGAGGVSVTDIFPSGVAGISWTCAPAGGAICRPSGSGNLFEAVALPSSGSVTFTATGTLSPFTFGLTNVASVAPPAGTYDPNAADNRATVISAVEPTRAHTLAPCRVVDTRVSPPALGANSVREFTVGGSCGVPADARAVAVIATVVNPGEAGNLRLFPAGIPVPLASMLNFGAGRTRANNAIVPLGPGGQVSVLCEMQPGSTAQADFVLDVFAYFK